jgi:hypothetical protein
MPLVTPTATAESHWRNVLQAVQGALELAEDPGTVVLPRTGLERWQGLLREALQALAEAPQGLKEVPDTGLAGV